MVLSQVVIQCPLCSCSIAVALNGEGRGEVGGGRERGTGRGRAEASRERLPKSRQLLFIMGVGGYCLWQCGLGKDVARLTRESGWAVTKTTV